MVKGLKRMLAAATGIAMTAVLTGCDGDGVVVLNPKGEIGQHQLDLILISSLLCLVVLIPVLVLTFYIVWKYRHDRKSAKAAKYDPEWEHSTKLETIWWGIPIVIIAILAAVTINYSYKLEPSKPLEHEAKPIVIQVTSLDWKWLFQYPEQGIATVNYLQFPEDVPVEFRLTSDAPMNSFWIPQLGGQIYTMSGMEMKLHLIADEPGDYMGMGANFSGKDFGKMNFTAKASSRQEFDDWVASVKASSPALTDEGYNELSKPGVSEVTTYSSIPEGLFERIVHKYGAHEHGGGSTEGAQSTEHQHDASSGEAAATSGEHDMHDMSSMTPEEHEQMMNNQ
ncbi:ubiquinol oxidase subunit II [Cohnella suwonensis]|uniref:Quinol oxidase subunit 2 n=1 Tax=Cohnella suwonensis TaxID=696072 RepID=A0ABW0LWQ6_9BACL